MTDLDQPPYLTFEHAGATFLLDHNGIDAQDENWGEFSVYQEDELVAEIWSSAYGNGLTSVPLPPDEDLIRLAKDAIDEER